MTPKSRGRLFVVSAPSGSGKSTLCRLVMARRPKLIYSVSYTTRKPRAGEESGRDYNFVDDPTFDRMIAQDEFLEWANIFGRRYGTGRLWVLDHLELGYDVICDVDVVGAAAIKKNFPEAVLIFIVPPTFAELARRLADRGTETEGEVKERLERSVGEIARRGLYDYLIINGDLEKAGRELADIMDGRPFPPLSANENFWPEFFGGLPDGLKTV